MKSLMRRPKKMDFERLGFETARETRDLEKAKEICGQELLKHEARLQPEINSLAEALRLAVCQATSLVSQLYDEDDLLNDKAMLARRIIIAVLATILAGVLLASLGASIVRFLLFGLSAIPAIFAALVLTIAVAGIGHLAFEKLLQKRKKAQAVLVALAAGLMFAGLFLLAQAGGIAVAQTQSSSGAESGSYVEGQESEPASEADSSKAKQDEQRAQSLLSSAVTLIMLSSDLMLALLLGVVVELRTDEKYVAWRKLANLNKQITKLKRRTDMLKAQIEIAQRDCTAGVLRFFHAYRKQRQPYFLIGAAFLIIALLKAFSASAQTIEREEGTLIDTSGSIGAGGANNELFHEYLKGARQLLLTEPPSSRVIVSLISTESFGSVREVLKGWTPPARGVFTDELVRARRQLASSFEANTTNLKPISAGTDIIGGLWHLKTLMESDRQGNATRTREIWIFSDMMNETAALPMPALLARGPEKMLEHAKKNGLLVPLEGYRIHVVGASTRGLSPQAWKAISDFWRVYFRAAGAELASYSAEETISRTEEGVQR